jgi:peptide deformylase
MALRRIRTFGDPVLRTPAKPVEAVTDLHTKLIADMFETMREAPGVGLAAPQVGVLERVFVYETEDIRGVLINPKITDRSRKSEVGEEGCLSLPGLLYPVVRAATVSIEGMDENEDPVRIEDATDLLARIFQHETDHLDGVLFIDHLDDEARKEALTILRNQALGLPIETHSGPAEETL